MSSQGAYHKNTIQEIQIHDLSHDGRGVGRLFSANSEKKGKACFVSGALPDEQVRWKRTKSKSSFDEGVLVELITASSDRVEPQCKYYESCGGCQLQHMAPDAQLSWKEHQLMSAVEKAGLEPKNWLPALSKDVWGYRRRARLAVNYKSAGKKGTVKIGFREKGSHQIVEISQCLVLDDRLNKLIPYLGSLAKQLKNHGLTQIELSAADSQLAVCFYVKRAIVDSEITCLELKEQAQTWFRLPGQQAQLIQHQVIEGSGLESPLATKLTNKIEMIFTPSQFIQVNGSMNRAMIAQAIELSQPNASTRVLDLFCGAGNFSLAFAEHSMHVHGIEGSSSLCRQADSNAQQQGYTNLDFQVMDLDKSGKFKSIATDNVDLVILDPPRAGAASLVPWLNKSGAEKLLYISCHPATMVRDLQGLSEKYRIDSMGVMNMFPHTAHLEAMALLIKTS